ncbi:uncharacterized protein BBA_09365 [Beauveria bassiana ARSEF 2860]|uniref:Uncharacterized protein n=1 Tax=Beauveria bassiana (strain ARSEF 2860) TaxID=655819 RepID=J4KL77_BEAB2|nr:uncharacterized protein BBA_09365 [Beauveria bassiana ARSEF 2860]EJP61724.1 hypothetical protein BBA_09365 [Beauveria bassiana ARSEF 2860]
MQPDYCIKHRSPTLKDKDICQRLLVSAKGLVQPGYDLSSLSKAEYPEKLLQLLTEASPTIDLAQLTLNVDLLRPPEGLRRLAGNSSKSLPQDREQFRTALVKRTDSILRSWHSLRRLKRKGVLNRFQVIWARMGMLERRSWLQRNFPDLPQNAQASIHAWLQSPTLESPPNSKLFFYRLLNTEILSRDNILPELLEFRATHHPAYLRDLDGRSIYLGVYCGSLISMAVTGTISFPMEQSNDTYDFTWNEAEDLLPDLAQAEPPTVGLHKLGAQQKIYEWLVESVQLLPKAIVGYHNELCCDPANDLSVLMRSQLSDYHKPHDRVSITYLHSLLTAALDESLFDLAQVRKYPDIWQEWVQGTGWEHVCRTLFMRIDVFSTLVTHSTSLQQEERYEITLKANNTRFRALVAFCCLSNSLITDTVRQLPSHGRWSPSKIKNESMSKLLQLLQKCDPVVDFIPLLDVMMVIDDESKSCASTQRMPQQLTRVLHDLAVLAACERELETHCRFAEDIASYAKIVKEVTEEISATKRPWKMLIGAALNAIDAETAHKLTADVCNKTSDLAKRHQRFWMVFDKGLKGSADTTTQNILDEVLKIAPENSSVDDEQAFASLNSAEPPAEPTQTQLNRSKHHRGHNRRTEVPQTARGPRKAPEMSRRPTITLFTQLQFWNSILAKSSEGRSHLKWTDFCAALAGIGFKIRPTIGAAYQFYAECHQRTIVFHKPHPKASLPHTKARREWLDRLTRRFILQMPEDLGVRTNDDLMKSVENF